MKTLPAGLPKLPSGLVYLGLGGTFNISSGRSARPTHACLHPTVLKWQGPCNWDGTDKDIHYAAPADSEIVKLNTPPALDLSKLPIGTRLRRRDGVVGVLKSRTNALYYLGYPDYIAINDTDHYVDGKRCSFKTSTDDVFEILPDEAPSELEALKARVAVLEKELADGKAKACAAAPAKWEPAYHRFSYAFNTRSGESKVVNDHWHSEKAREAGHYFKTKRASDSAAEYRNFFTRLLNLAAELNPSGLVGGEFNVAFDQDISGLWEVGTPEDSYQDISWIFETKEAAQKAADILNRDGWKPPVRK